MIMPTRLKTHHKQALNRYLETGEQGMDWQSVDLVALHQNGQEIPISISFSKFNQGDEPRFIGTFRVTSPD